MKQIILFAVSVLFAFSFLSCNKNETGDESIFYGMWVKGTNAGDTLQFYQKNGKNILAINWSFNPLLYAPNDFEYFYSDGHLSMRYPNYPGPDIQVKSLTWKQVGQEFEVQGIELFPFMSSRGTYFTYHKIR